MIGEILATGNTTCASLDTSATNLLTSATLDNINSNYILTSANAISPEFSADTPKPDFEAFRMIEPTNTININIGQPTVYAVYVDEIVRGVDSQAVFEVF